MSNLELLQFPISHFCEKVRWALDYKGVPHRRINLVPGLHIRYLQKLSAPGTSVPALHDAESGETLVESSAILDWLERQFPEPSWTPPDAFHAAEVTSWESRLDRDLGPHVRRLCYATLLEHRGLTTTLLGHQSNWYAKPFLFLAFPKLRSLMKRHMRINPEEAEQSLHAIRASLEQMASARGSDGYLVGNAFSRADLTAAALLAPLTRQPEYGVPWPAQLPDPLATTCAELAPDLEWVGELYTRHRA